MTEKEGLLQEIEEWIEKQNNCQGIYKGWKRFSMADSIELLRKLSKTKAEINRILKAWGMYKEYRNKVLKALDSERRVGE